MIVFLGCSCSASEPKFPSLEEECKLSGSKDSKQCQILEADDKTLPEKENLMGYIYFFVDTDEIKDCNKAKYWFNKSAETGNKEALNNLATVYLIGCGAEKNYKKAEEYLLIANKKGSLQAKANLGELYREGGYGIERDYDKALYWYQLAIEDNPYRAYRGLAATYLIQENYAEAYKYNMKSAELGNPEAQYNLGVMYDRGIFVEKDIDKAKYWYEKAAANGWANAQYNLNNLLKQQAN